MTLNGVIALILRYFPEFDSFAGRLRHCGCAQNIVFQLYLAKTVPRSSRTVSLGQLSFLYFLFVTSCMLAVTKFRTGFG